LGRSEGKSPLEKRRRRREDNIKMDFRETGIDGMDAAGLGEGVVAGFCEHGTEPSSSIRKQDIF
jgi:hypothetical protein